MSRGLVAANRTEVDAVYLQPVLLVKLQFDTPIFVHSGVGPITFGGDTYTGVGDFGAVGAVEESESVGPSPISLTLSGIDAAHITEALDAGNYGDIVTLYEGYRQDDGLLVADPWIVAGGTFEHATISLGENNAITIVIQHDLERLQEKAGDKYTDEDQQQKFAGDQGFKFVAAMVNQKLLWAGGRVGGGQDPSDVIVPPGTDIP